MQLPNDETNFWKVASVDESEDAYWHAYEATRPNYADDGFLDIVYDYHSSKDSSSFITAHDVGCGSGVAAAELATRFMHVVASDNNASSLNTARRFLSSIPQDNDQGREKFSFTLCPGEELIAHHAPQSADLIAAAECLPLIDGAAALSSFHTILRPGGTVAIWFYARPHFSEPEYASACQSILDRILDCAFSKVINGHGPERTESWKKAINGMLSWLDYLDFFETPGKWERVVRRKWNSKSAEMSFFTPAACDFKLGPTSKVTAEEEVIEIEDSRIWEKKWDVKGVKEFVDYSFPNIKDVVDEDEEIKGLMEQLADAMGGEQEVRTFTWPVVLILATKS